MFNRESQLITYLSGNVSGNDKNYPLRGHRSTHIEISSEKYDEVVGKFENDAAGVGPISIVQTERGEESRALYMGVLVTLVNPNGMNVRGIELEAESGKKLEEVVLQLKLPLQRMSV